MAKEERFVRVYTQGKMTVTEIWVDTQTGVNYIYHAASPGGGLTPLIDAEGKVIVTPVDALKWIKDNG